MLAHKLMTDPSHALALVGIAQQVANPIGGAFRGMDQKTGMIVVDLQGDAATGAASSWVTSAAARIAATTPASRRTPAAEITAAPGPAAAPAAS